jgi:hypothetical protein
MAQEQNLRNHARIVPLYHFGVFFPLVAGFAWWIYRLTQGVTGESVIQFLVAIALLLMFVSLRAQVLTVQDRVIRLEMQLRLAQALPPALHSAIGQLSPKQLVALRFASDAELPALVRQVVAGQLSTQKEIKAQIRDWQADFLRA